MEIKNLIADIIFPYEIDSIHLLGNRNEEFTLRLKVDQHDIINSTKLYTNDEGFFILSDLSQDIALYTKDDSVLSLSITASSGNIEKTYRLLPCRARIDINATDFIFHHFFTSLKGFKQTISRATESLYFYAEGGTKNIQIEAIYLTDNLTLEKRSFNQTITIPQEGIHSFSFQPLNYEYPNMTLMRISVLIDNKQMIYELLKSSYESQIIYFTNLFGKRECMVCASCEMEEKFKHEIITIGGIKNTYTSSPTTKYKGYTYMLRDDQLDFFRDFCSSTHHELASGERIVITNGEIMTSTLATSNHNKGIIEFELSNSTKPFFYKKDKIFDFTFDSTFE